MRKNYPLLSKELNDMFQELYYRLVYLLGYDNDQNQRTYTGVYDTIEIQIGELIYNISFQLTPEKDKLIIKNPSDSKPAHVYNEWGNYIVINELRSF